VRGLYRSWAEDLPSQGFQLKVKDREYMPPATIASIKDYEVQQWVRP